MGAADAFGSCLESERDASKHVSVGTVGSGIHFV